METIDVLTFAVFVFISFLLGVIVGVKVRPNSLKISEKDPNFTLIATKDYEQAMAILEREKQENQQLQLEAAEVMKTFE